MSKKYLKMFSLVLATVLLVILSACGASTESETATSEAASAAATDSAAPAESGGEAASGDALKVALLMEGPLNDGGWNILAYEALEIAEQDMGAEIAYTDNITANDMAQIARQYAIEGYTAIVGHGFAFGEAFKEVAEEFPDTFFLCYGGTVENGTNLASANLALRESGAVLGTILGSTEGVTKVGVANAFESAASMEVFENLEMMALEQNPDLEFSYVFIGDYNDVAKSKEATSALLADGCDVIVTEMSTAQDAMLEVVKEAGAYMMHIQIDLTSLDPDVFLACPNADITTAYLAAFEDIASGNMTGELHWYGFESGALSMGGYGNMITDEQIALADETLVAVEAGEIEFIEVIESSAA